MITMQNVRKKYKDFELELSLEIPEGRITGFVGKNGAGKSTAIKLILGLVKPDMGSICVLGNEGGELPVAVKQKIGVSLTESGFSSQFTVEGCWHILAKMYPDFQKDFFDQKCDVLKLPRKKKLKEFSTGMKAKLRVLTAISHKADLLILDEPTAGLDVEARNEILDLLREYIAQDEKRTILITSHISTDLESLCDDIYLIHDGKIILHEDTDVILEQYGILKVDEEQYRTLDKTAVIKAQKETYGYACFTNDRRFYQEKKLTRQQLMELVETARLTPSAANRQPVRYKLVCDEVMNEKVFECLGWAGYLKDWAGPVKGERPSAYIIMATDKNAKAECDEGIIGQTILLAAVEKGMGGCFLGNVNRAKLAGVIGLSDDMKIDYCIALGYPKEEVVLEDIPDGGDIKYYRDANQVHHVPKIKLDDLIL